MRKNEDKFKEILKAIEEYNIMFIKYIPSVCDICEKSIYQKYPKGSKKYNEIVKALSKNKSKTKMGLMKKWYESDNPTVQIALYKLIGSDEERKKLCSSYVEVKDDNAKDKITLNKEDISIIVKSLKDE